MCKPLASSCNVHPLLQLCRFCGFIWTCDKVIRCPCCNFGNIHVVPISMVDDPRFTFSWLKGLKGNDFEYIEERLEVEAVVE